METSLSTVILFSLIGGLFSLAGAVCLLGRRKLAKKLALIGTPFAAGALLAAVFGDLLQDALSEGVGQIALTWTLIGILGFFMMEYSFRWFHHHHEHKHENKSENAHLKTMAIIGDTIHNALDGVAIAAAFLISPSAGVVTTVAVAAHEIPQEIGDFGLLLASGMSRKRVLAANVVSSLATTIAAIITFQLGSQSAIPLGQLIGISSGFLLYIAVADLIPTIHADAKERRVGPVLLLLSGVATVLIAIKLAEAYTASHL